MIAAPTNYASGVGREPDDAWDSVLRALASTLTPDVTKAAPVWTPMADKPQALAYQSEADVVGFGGAAGAGKSDLLLGTAFTKHRRAVIFRAHFTELDDLVDRGNEIMDGRALFVWGTARRWLTPDLRRVRLGAIDDLRDFGKYRGRPNDFLGIDEAAEFRELVVRSLMGWVRTTDRTQPTQTMLTFNPPTTPEGEWIIQYFGAWLDPNHPNPARPGELRWYASIDNVDVEVPDSSLVDTGGTLPDGRPLLVKPQSRTFIPGRVTDNPYLMATDYPAQLNALPEPLRSQVLFGDFSITPKDHEWQVIPSEWVRAAMARGKTTPKPKLALRALGVDASRGGADRSVVASMWGNWISLDVYEGKDVPDGVALANIVEKHLSGQAVAYLDVIGIGTSPFDILKLRQRRVYGVNFAAGSKAKDKTHMLRFANLRAEAYWRVRELLDPLADWELCLPDDRELLAELCAPRYSAEGQTLQIEPKESISQRLHRSPDKADAVVLLLWGIMNARPMAVA